VKQISVIIPTLNESARIAETLESLPRDRRLERIVVDGGSTDDTRARAESGAGRVLTSGAGPARQMNAGAARAEGDTLLFLHADSRLPKGAIDQIEAVLRDPGVPGGAFQLSIDSPKRSLRWIARAANLRTRLTRVPYGDQGIFVRRTVFERLGGFPDLPIMEDLEFSRRMKRTGKIAILSSAVTTSARRWEREGILTVTLRNRLFAALYFLGVSPLFLARRYRAVR